MATIRLQELDGTWQTLGADRALGISAERLTMTANAYGLDTASFELHRDPGAAWPDLSAFTPVEIEIGNQVCWSGRISETQSQDGTDRQLSIRCEGWQYHLDDDQIAKTYVNRSLGDWKPLGDYAPLGDDWVGHGGTVEINDGQIFMGWREGTQVNQYDTLGMVLDLGGRASYDTLTANFVGTAYQEQFRYPFTGTTTKGYGPALFDSTLGASGIPLQQWTSGASVSKNATRYTTDGRVFIALKAISTTAQKTTQPPDNPTDWAEFSSPLYTYAYFAQSNVGLATIANLTGQTIVESAPNAGGNSGPRLIDAYMRADTTGTGAKDVQDFSWSTFTSGVHARYLIVVMVWGQNTIANSKPNNSYGIKYTGISVAGSANYLNWDWVTDGAPYYYLAAKTANESVLKASDVITDAIASGAPELDTSSVQATTTSLQHFTTESYKTPREVIEQANSYHRWISRVDADKRLIFKPLPTAPRFEVGSWSGYEFTDQATTSGADIYSRVIVSGVGPDGSDLRVSRAAAQVATSVQLTQAGSSKLTADQQATLRVVSMAETGIGLVIGQAKITNSDDITAGQMIDTPDTWGASGIPTTGTYKAGTTYELRGSFYSDAVSGLAQTFRVRIGSDGYAIGSATRQSTGTIVTATTNSQYQRVVTFSVPAGITDTYQFVIYWTPDTDQEFPSDSDGAKAGIVFALGKGLLTAGDTFYLGAFGRANRGEWATGTAYAAYDLVTRGGQSYECVSATSSQDPATDTANTYWRTNYNRDLEIYVRAATLADRRGIRRTYQLDAPGVQTTETLTAIGDAWLYEHLRGQFRGSLTTTGPAAIRQADTGDSVHPSRLLLEAGEIVHLGDRIDPDSGQTGRDARIAAVSYDHDQQQLTLELDNRRDNLQTFLNRLQII